LAETARKLSEPSRAIRVMSLGDVVRQRRRRGSHEPSMGVDRVVSVSAKDDGAYKQQTDDRDFHHETSPYHFGGVINECFRAVSPGGENGFAGRGPDASLSAGDWLYRAL
jgi:hypothetical protein